MDSHATTQSTLNPLGRSQRFAMASIAPALPSARPMHRQRVLALGSIHRVLLAIVVLDIPFYCDVHYRYDQAVAEFSALGGLELSLTTFCVLALYGLWFAEAAIHRFTKSYTAPRINRWLILYLAAAVLSTQFASRRDLALNEIAILLQTFLLYVYVVKRVRTRYDIIFLATMLAFSVLCHSLVMFAVFGIGHSFQFGPWNFWIDGRRVGGTMAHNTSASFLEILLAPCLALAIAAAEPWRNRLASLAFLTGATALVMTFSRGGWLAGIVSVAILGVFAWRRGWLSPRIPIMLAVGLCVAAALFSGAVSEALTGKDRSPAEDRLALMRLAQHMIGDHPVVGVGANNFAVVMGDYVRHPEFTNAWLHVVHNKFLLVWAENGTIGLIAFLGFLVSTILCGCRCWKSGDRLLALLGFAFAMGILGQILHMNLDLFNTRPQIQVLWIACGLVTSIGALASSQPTFFRRTIQTNRDLA